MRRGWGRRRDRHCIPIVFLLAALTVLQPALAGDSNSDLPATIGPGIVPIHTTPAPGPKECLNLWQRIGPTIVGGVFIGGLGTAIGWLGVHSPLRHVYGSWRRGLPSLGTGVYFDANNIDRLLSAEEKQLVRHPRGNEEAIARLFVDKLYGDYDDEMLKKVQHATFPGYRFYPPHEYWDGRLASSFFKGQSEGRKRGICVQKALVLAAVLNHDGIKAEQFAFRFSPKFYEDFHVNAKEVNALREITHQTVLLPEQHLIADATLGVVMPEKEYRKYVLEEIQPYSW